jgi:L-methionine (R)-S-oxide reductase
MMKKAALQRQAETVRSMDKESLYKQALVEIKERLVHTSGIIPRMATVAAVLKNTLPHFFWCGFYFAEDGELVIGPYQGTSACANISYSGVCGASAQKGETVIVPDVHKFPGHIVCDEKSKSEIVVPVKDDEGRIIAVFDVDSSEYDSFNHIDKKYLEQIIPIVLVK